MSGPEDFVGSTLGGHSAERTITSMDPSSFAGHSIGAPPPPEPEKWSEGRKAATVAAAGVGAGSAAWMLKGLLRKAFPGTPVLGKNWANTSALKKIDEAIKKSDSGSSLKDMMGEYMRFTANTDKPVTFADFMATQPGHQHAVSTIQELLGESGNIPKIENGLKDRTVDLKSRVLNDIARALNVKPQSISEGLEKLKATKSQKAQPLYDAAFADKNPIRDTKLLDLFGTDVPNMSMMNALKARMKTLALHGKEAPSLFAADPQRKDAWKRLTTNEVPEQMFAGNEWGKLRQYYAPAVEDLHHMRSNLWDGYKASQKAGDNEAAKAYLDSWKKVTNYLDSATDGAYKKARDTYKGDSDVEDAFRIGSELLKMKPDEVRTALKGMGPDERQALASGFYGSMQDMNYQKMMREFVARPDRFPERRELLSAVFQDPQRLDQFMKNLEGEGAMTDGAAAFTSAPMSKAPEPRLPFLKAITPVGGGSGSIDPTANILSYVDPLKYLGWPSRRASRAGTDMLFREPTRSGSLTSHPDWDTIHRTPLSGLERAKQAGKWSGAGGAGGLGLYGASRFLPEEEQDVRSPIEMGVP